MCLLLFSLKAGQLVNSLCWDVFPPTVSCCVCFSLLSFLKREYLTSVAPSDCFSCIEFTFVSCVGQLRGLHDAVLCYFCWGSWSLCCTLFSLMFFLVEPCPLGNWFSLSTLTSGSVGTILNPVSGLKCSATTLQLRLPCFWN